MREILFQGKRVDNGEWVEGCGIIATENWVSIFTVIDDLEDNSADVEEYEVIPETVGEYTGLPDKNGKKIFEGNIVKFDDGTICSIELINGVYRVVDKQGFCSFSVHNYYSCLEVIGSIHDNSELLK